MVSRPCVGPAIPIFEETAVSNKDVTLPASYPIGFLALTTALSAGSCLGGWALLRWLFSKPLGDEFGPAFHTVEAVFSRLATLLAFSFLAVFLVASLALFAVAIITSHKVAGPLFRLQRVAATLRDGALVGRIHLRAGDQGKPVAEEINVWLDRLKRKRAELHGHVAELEAAAGRWEGAAAKGDVVEVQTTLVEVRELVQKIVRVVREKPA